jgi:hypothetical protein
MYYDMAHVLFQLEEFRIQNSEFSNYVCVLRTDYTFLVFF